MSRNIKRMGPQKGSRYQQGVIHPKTCKKIFESQKNEPIIYRSSLEKKFIIWCESNSNIKYWGSECIQIPYYSPIDQRNHTYNPDFAIEYIDGRRVVVEIKPFTQTQPPKATSNEYTRNQFKVNVLKWNAAKKYLDERGVSFVIITEKSLG